MEKPQKSARSLEKLLTRYNYIMIQNMDDLQNALDKAVGHYCDFHSEEDVISHGDIEVVVLTPNGKFHIQDVVLTREKLTVRGEENSGVLSDYTVTIRLADL
jgi:hypothetical protein